MTKLFRFSLYNTLFKQLMDFYSASGIPILWCCFFQTIGIGWFFGATKFANCVEQMTGYKPHAYWWWTWAVIAPGTMFVSHIRILSCQYKGGKWSIRKLY